MDNILIIKTNASGDVLRTTVLLHVLEGNIFWITAGYNIPLFPDEYFNLTLIPFENIPADLFALRFDLIINLEEDPTLAKKVSAMQANKLIGVFWNNGMLDYSEDSAGWFDMSLISKLPASDADKLKRNNTSSYQNIIFEMIGKTFYGQPYILYKNDLLIAMDRKTIGIETRVGSRWPNKYWKGFEELVQTLRKQGFEMVIFEERMQLREYMEDIQHCRLIITGDTLAMHIALGYEIPCVGIFNCTSPYEIYDYGFLQKMISPMLNQVFYKTLHLQEAMEAVSVGKVLDSIYAQLD